MIAYVDGKWTPAEGLPDVYIAMGETAENVAEIEDVSREAMDEFAYRSQHRTGAAIERGFYEREITPYTTADGTVVTADDCPRPGTELEKLASLAPAFRPTGRVTAGNACPLNDGAAAVVIMSDTKASELQRRNFLLAGVALTASSLATGAPSVARAQVSSLNPQPLPPSPSWAS